MRSARVNSRRRGRIGHVPVGHSHDRYRGRAAHCDGQVLLSFDMLGLFESAPPFVKQYARPGESILAAASDFAGDVRGVNIRRLRRREPLPPFS